ncbi:hypothetical protein B0T24DRAFT_256723 [Lasiosphaeria ovina]|uniref:Uncharacterized protein n=1 Tax=Lasiosphaeria ovina TaxID=92902 RepID=A0AAE0KAW3_9PEZI|nr:hypothetical protein B0T24DRAFT_256723 [Lasiosphaeria ovina]
MCVYNSERKKRGWLSIPLRTLGLNWALKQGRKEPSLQKEIQGPAGKRNVLLTRALPCCCAMSVRRLARHHACTLVATAPGYQFPSHRELDRQKQGTKGNETSVSHVLCHPPGAWCPRRRERPSRRLDRLVPALLIISRDNQMTKILNRVGHNHSSTRPQPGDSCRDARSGLWKHASCTRMLHGRRTVRGAVHTGGRMPDMRLSASLSMNWLPSPAVTGGTHPGRPRARLLVCAGSASDV